VIAERKALGLPGVDVGDMANRAGSDQLLDHRSPECAGASGDDHMTVAKVHVSLPLR